MSASKLLHTVGELIRTSRVDAALTQRALGQRAGIVSKYVSEIERGTRDIPLSTLYAIVEKGLQLDLDIIFRRWQDTAHVALPTNVEDVARLIAQLGMEERNRVVTLVHGIVELAR